MKILLDECLNWRLKKEFEPHEVFTVQDMGWSGLTNGTLMGKASEHDFSVFVTIDKNLPFQQNISLRDILEGGRAPAYKSENHDARLLSRSLLSKYDMRDAASRHILLISLHRALTQYPNNGSAPLRDAGVRYTQARERVTWYQGGMFEQLR